jgi:hypothetical protein
MFQLSSSTTLFFKIFLPCIWLAFFGAFFVGVLLLDDAYIMGYSIDFFIIGLGSFLLMGFLFFYFTVFQLKRIDINEAFVFISSYYTNVKYPLIDMEKIKITDYGLFHLGQIQLKGTGIFGNKISFLSSQRNLKKYLESHPEQEAIIER